MKPINLKDLVPQGAEFTLSATGRVYRMRPVNLADERWLGETFGPRLEKIFTEIRMIEVSRIVFHQLEEEDKQDFKARDVTFMDEQGETVTKRIGGAELLFWQIKGWEEKTEIFMALMKTIGVSREVVEQLTDEERLSKEAAARREAERLQAMTPEERDAELEKKSPSQLTGPSSSTGSLMSTDGVPSTFGQEP